MKTKEKMENLLNLKYRKYEVNSRECSLDLLDRVTPETVIGCHYDNSRVIRSEIHGRVATMYYNPKHDSLIVMIVASGDWPEDGHDNNHEIEVPYVPGLYLG